MIALAVSSRLHSIGPLLLRARVRTGAVDCLQRHFGLRTFSVCQLPKRTFRTSSFLREKVTIKVPIFDDSISQGDVFFDKKVGDPVTVDERIATIETDKITVPIQASASGVIVELFASDGETVNSNSPLIVIDTEQAVEPPDKGKESAEPEKDEETATKQAMPDPRVAEAYRVMPDQTCQTDGSDRKIKEVTQTKRALIAPPPELSRREETPPPRPGHIPEIVTKGPQGERRKDIPVRMSRMRLRIAERLKASQTTMATLTTFNEIDMSYVYQMRKKYKDIFSEKHKTKLGIMSVFVQACTRALIEFPTVNGFIDGDSIIYHNYVDISVAVATPKGLVVPVIRDTHKMSMADIEKAVYALGQKARENNITMEDMDGGTFTISNGGIYGGLFGTPIINECQSAILGIYGVKERPVAIDGRVEIRPMTYVALSYDHRLIDGREAVTFLGRIKDFVEDPVRCLLEV